MNTRGTEPGSIVGPKVRWVIVLAMATALAALVFGATAADATEDVRAGGLVAAVSPPEVAPASFGALVTDETVYLDDSVHEPRNARRRFLTTAAVTTTPTPVAECLPFLYEPTYHNRSGELDVSWFRPASPLFIGADLYLWLDDSSGFETVFAGDWRALVDVTSSAFDTEPAGYGLTPGPHVLHAIMIQGATACLQHVVFEALPPPTDVSGDGAPFAESPSRQVSLRFEQALPVDVDVPLWWAMPPGLETFSFSGVSFTWGSTATAGEDFSGATTNYPAVNSMTMPAHSTTQVRRVSIIDDECRESTEHIEVKVMFGGIDDPFLAMMPLHQGFQIAIVDDDPDYCVSPPDDCDEQAMRTGLPSDQGPTAKRIRYDIEVDTSPCY